MCSQGLRCVLLADRHHGLTEGVRELLESEFSVVVMVADETSLIEGAKRLHPTVAVADISLARSEGLKWMRDLRADDPTLTVVALSVYDEPNVCRMALAAGVNGFVLKRDIAAELLPAVTAALAGKRYISAGVLEHMPPAERALHQAPSNDSNHG